MPACFWGMIAVLNGMRLQLNGPQRRNRCDAKSTPAGLDSHNTAVAAAGPATMSAVYGTCKYYVHTPG